MDETWTIGSSAEWEEATAAIDATLEGERGLILQRAGEGQWTSTWQSWQAPIRSLEMTVEAEIDLFDDKKIQVVISGAETPYSDASQMPHNWYGRCMIAIVDEHRWIMALRSGLNHISWGKRDTIHLITSSDEGRTWGALNRWFDGSPIAGLPYEDGHTHSEPGLYRTPNGELVLQFWRTDYSSGTKQLRSMDNGKTWDLDIDRIDVQGVIGAEGDCAIGTEGYFVDPENPFDVYMAFQYFHYNGQAGTLLARSGDNCKTYSFVSWICPLADEKVPNGGATFEPAIEYVGDRTIVAVLRDAAGDHCTWQCVSRDMGVSFGQPVDISDQINGGIANGQWQRARLYKESNPYFQYGNGLDYAKGEGRLWGFGLHSNGGGYTRKPVVYWSDDNGQSWSGPELLHGLMQPGTDTGYGDLKRRGDNTFVAATYYANEDSTQADVEQYTFGGARARVMMEFDDNGDGQPDADSGWRELYDGSNSICLRSLPSRHWRLKLVLAADNSASGPRIGRVHIEARY
jgi:hypothetical protein